MTLAVVITRELPARPKGPPRRDVMAGPEMVTPRLVLYLQAAWDGSPATTSSPMVVIEQKAIEAGVQQSGDSSSHALTRGPASRDRLAGSSAP